MLPINSKTIAKDILVQSLPLDEELPPVTPQNIKFHPKALAKAESKLIGLYNKIGNVLWMRQFLEAQGCKINTNIVYQDSMSNLSLALSCVLPFTLYPFWTEVRVKGNPYPVMTG